MKHTIKNPLVLKEGTEYYADSTAKDDQYRPMPGQYVSLEVAQGMVDALKKIKRVIEESCEYPNSTTMEIQEISEIEIKKATA